MGERHEHTKTPSAYEGVSGVNLCFFRLLLFRLLLPFVLAFSRSPILASFWPLVPPFTFVNVRRLWRIVVGIQYALIISSRSYKRTS
jgi:hypothetical protein